MVSERCFVSMEIFALSRTRALMQKLSALSKDWLKPK